MKPNRYIFLGLILIAFFFFTFGLWATMSSLQGAIVVNGEIAYTTGRTIDIIHPDGGRIQTLNVEPGDSVRAGEAIATLDPTLLDVEIKILEDRLFELNLKKDRLQSLLDGSTFSPPIPPDPVRKSSVEREIIAFQTTIEEWASIKRQYDQQRTELKGANEALVPILQALKEEQSLLQSDLSDTESLLERGLGRRAEVTDLKRNLINTQNTILRTQADIERNATQIEGIDVSLDRELATRRTQFVTQLGTLAEQIPELKDRLTGLYSQKERLTISAPVNGVINELNIQSTNVTLLAGTLIATLVPTSQAPQIIAALDPTHIDEVFVGQKAYIRPLTRTQNTLELDATVVRIGRGIRLDPQTGVGYYELLLEANLDPLLGEDGTIVSGTPFEVSVRTQERSPLKYLMEPVEKSFRRAMRE